LPVPEGDIFSQIGRVGERREEERVNKRNGNIGKSKKLRESIGF